MFCSNCGAELKESDVTCPYCGMLQPSAVFFVSKGHRKPETYRANLCDQHKFCASRSVLLGTE